MEYAIREYSDIFFFETIERLINGNVRFSDEKEEKEYLSYRFNLFQSDLLDRFNLIITQTKSFLVEESYTDYTWKELYALHYSNTNYSYGNKVMRIHFWNKDLCTSQNKDELNNDIICESYLGYVTLRPIPDYNLMLSFVIPNWRNLKYTKDSWIMTYEKIVHIADFSINILTTPFYFQDTVVTRCAHADMLMFSLFLHHAYKIQRLKISDMIENDRYYPIPNGGLEYSDMLDIFYRNKIPVNFYVKSGIQNYEQEINKYIGILNAHIESRLPVIVYNNKHVVLVIGHTHETPCNYVVYDDSGYFLSHKVKSKNFIGIVNAYDLFPKQGVTYMIAATFEKVYLDPERYFKFLNIQLKNYEKRSEDKFPEEFSQCRNIIADNSILKQFLCSHCIEKENEDISKRLEEFLKMDLPHYLWYSEYTRRDSRFVLLADPTYPSSTKENIFSYGDYFCTKDKNGLSLLTLIESIKNKK